VRAQRAHRVCPCLLHLTCCVNIAPPHATSQCDDRGPCSKGWAQRVGAGWRARLAPPHTTRGWVCAHLHRHAGWWADALRCPHLYGHVRCLTPHAASARTRPGCMAHPCCGSSCWHIRTRRRLHPHPCTLAFTPPTPNYARTRPRIHPSVRTTGGLQQGPVMCAARARAQRPHGICTRRRGV